jgi:DNA polymerase-3 subunit beta
MDLTLNRAALLDQLQLLQGVLERRTTIPILSNVLLTAAGDRLELAATDLDVTVYTRCPAIVRADGRTTIHGRVFFDLVRSLPADTRDLTANTSRVEVKCGAFSSQIASLDPADYPTLPDAPDGQGFGLPLATLQGLVDYTNYAVSSEEGHFQYNAALLLLGPAALEMVATDGHRLAFARAENKHGKPPFEQQLLPRKLLSQLRRLAASADATLFVGRNDNHLAFRLGDTTLLSRVLEARFPQYERVLVRDNPYRVVLQRSDFAASLRRVALLASERTHGVQLQFDDDTLSLSSVGFDLGQAAEILSCSYRGPGIKLLVNAHYVLDFLSAVPANAVELQLREGEGPLVLTPTTLPPTITECLYVIMPIRL